MTSVKLPRANPMKRPMRLTGFSSGIEVEKPRERIQFFLEHQDPLVLDDVADLACRVQNIAELASANGADLHAGWVPAGARALDTEGALFHHALGARPVPQVVHVRVHLRGRKCRLGPVEMASAVRARSHAVAAADAPVVIDHDDAILLHPGGASGTDFGAGRIFALLAAHRNIE